MPKFSYVSRSARGERMTAVAEAANRQDLLADLKGRGLVAVEICEIGQEPAAATRMRRWAGLRIGNLRGVDTGELAMFWRELATMLDAGLPLPDALQSIAREVRHPRLRRVLSDVLSGLWEGHPFSRGLGRHRGVFSPMSVALVEAGEESGTLSTVTARLADYLENRDRVLRKVQAALAYPLFLAGFFLCVLAVATFWLIPLFRDIYADFKATLPPLTEAVFRVNELMLRNMPWLVAIGAAGLLALVMWARRPSGRACVDRLLLRAPLFGKLVLWGASARLSRSVALLLSGGIPINRALEMAQETASNAVLAGALAKAREEILTGGRIAASLEKQRVFPHMVIRMVSAGEETGNLSALLEKAAAFYETRVDAAVTTVNALIEPIMIVVIGMFVLVFVLALYMPIFSLALKMKG